MNTLLLAARNLTRNGRRSATTLMAMVVGAVCILLFGGYSQNITYGLQTDFVRSGGHLQIQHKNYFLYGSGDPIDYGIANYAHVMDVVKNDVQLAPLIKVVTPTLQLGGVAGNYAAGVSRTVFASGRVVEDQNRMSAWNEYGFPGKSQPAALTNTASDAAVVGEGLARVLKICGPLHAVDCPPDPRTDRDADHGADRGAGAQDAHEGVAEAATLPQDIAAIKTLESAGRAPVAAAGGAKAPAASPAPTIEMLAATVHGAPNVAELTVVKAEEQGVKELDDMYIALHLEEAQRLIYGRGAREVTAIAIQLVSTADIPRARARLQQLLDGPLRAEPLEILDFETLNPYYGQALALFGTIFGFISILIGAVVLFTISNTMSMAVIERTVEIGTLRAVGLRRSGIRRLFLCEGMLLGVLGAALGISLALLLAYLVNHGGITWMPPGRSEPVSLHIRVWGEPRLILSAAVGLVAIAVLSAWWPAHRAARMNVVEALRHV